MTERKQVTDSGWTYPLPTAPTQTNPEAGEKRNRASIRAQQQMVWKTVNVDNQGLYSDRDTT